MIAIISDIHGNLAALEAVLGEIERLRVADVVCLGDTAGYYSAVNECCDLLRSRGIFSLRGNHDDYLVSDALCPRSKSATQCIEYQSRVISDENRRWLATLRPSAVYSGIDIVHGGWNDPVDEYVRPSSEYFAAIVGTCFASGHTHVPCIWSGGGKTYCNPGSVGQPRDGDPRASFATWHEGQFSLHRVAYDIGRTQTAMRDAGFPAYFYENLSVGSRIGGKIDSLHRN